MDPNPGQLPETGAQIVRRVWLEQLASSGHTARELVLVDADFSGWPLSDPGVLQALTHWMQRRRRLVLLASDFGAFQTQHARWLAWRRPWSHQVECRQADQREGAALRATVLLAPGCAMDAAAHGFPALRLTTAPRRVQDIAEQVRECLAHACVVLPTTVLGL